MKKSYFFKFFVFALVGAIAILPSCQDYDDDISRLDKELGDAKTELTGSIASQLAALKTELNTSVDNKVKTVADDLAASKSKLDALEANSATKDQLDDVKAEILQQVVTLEVLEDLQADYDSEIAAILARIATLEEDGATKAELAALETEITGMLSELQDELDAIDVRVTALDTSLTSLMAKHDDDVQDLIASIAGLKAELDPRITTIETLLDIADGESGVLNGIAEDLADQLSKIGANADAIALLRTDLEEGLAEQLALIEANKAAIEAVEDDLAAKYAELVDADADLLAQIEANYEELDGKITLNKDAIDALTLRVVAIEDELPVIKKSITDLGEALSMKIEGVYKSLDHRVYTLTYIPDYTSEDGTPQIVVRGLTEWKFNKPANANYRTPGWSSAWNENWSVLQKGVIYKGVTILRYNVSPTNVTMSDFEIHALLNKTSLLRLRSTETKSAPIMLTQHATLENGVLSVPVMVEENDYDLSDEEWDWGTNVSVALQVKNINVEMDNDEDRYVTSTEYVKANFDLSDGRIALNEKSLKTNGTLLPVGIEYANIASASYASDISLWNGKSQSGNMTDVLNHTINLNDYVYGMFDDYYGDWEKLTDFGFNAHTFKFRRVYLESEGVNQSNDYVTLNETTGVIGVVPDGQTVNQAAVGRTPIVEVTALVNGKVHAVGYIKIVITDNFDASDVEFTFNLEDYILGCNSDFQLTNVDIDAIDFDKVFNHSRIKLGKDAFFAEYNQIALTDAMVTKVSPPTPASATVGAIGGTAEHHVEFGWAINPETQSVNLYNYLQANITNDAPVGTYEVKTRLKSNGYRPDVVITWNFKVVLPTDISLIPNSIYYKNGGIVVNPTIFEQGALSSTAYEALLNNTFVHESGNFDYEGLTQTCQDYLTPYFVFTEVPAGFTISTDKKSIWKDGLKAAEIVQVGDEFFVRLNNIGSNPPSGPWGNNTPFSDAAKQLVGKTVKIQPRAYINSQPLNDISLYDPFTVMFRKPLTLQFPDNAVVYDQANDGVKNVYTLNLYSPTVIKDWNGKLISVLTNEGRSLIEHYEIDFTMEWHPGNWWNPSTWELGSPFKLGKPQVNLQVDGTIGGAYRDIPMGTGMKIDIDYEEGEIYTHPGYGSMNTPATITFEWSNSSTGEVQNEFMVRIPITVKHKWSPADEPLMDYLYITVKPGNGQP